MNWAYLNFGLKLNLGFNQSPKSNSIKWAKGNLVYSPLCRLPSLMQWHFDNFLQLLNAYIRRGRGEKRVEIQKRKSDQSERRKKVIRNPRINLRVFE